MKKEDKTLLAAGGMAGIIASLCCLGPIVLVMFGLSGVSFALSIGKYSWFFLSLAIILLIIALVVYYKKKNCCNIKGLKKNWKQIVMVFAIMALILIIIKYWLATYLAQWVYR